MSNSSVVIVGLGEVGGPLLELVARAGDPVVGIDVAPAELPAPGSVDVMHLCFPFEVDDFVAEAVRYVDLLEPRLTIVNSTVAVGTTRAIHERTGARIAHSPVRGKHARMLEELSSYVKFVGGIDERAGQEAAAHFSSLGLRTRLLSSPEAAELAKLTETTYFGLLIAWAQEVERYCDVVGADYEEIISFYEEIGFFPPVRYFPGVIEGHCVMPNIEILERLGVPGMLDAIRCSNALKTERDGALSEALEAARRR
jgi:UDP-N-acetyl-D-mannosaminuronate dehydrogenase